jgi:uncharacterized protein
LPRSPGTCRSLAVTGSLAEDIQIGLVKLSATTPITVDGTMESVGDGVLVTATVTATLQAQCSRCLKEFALDSVVELRELYAYQPSDDDEVLVVSNDAIDLTDVIRDAILIDTPLIPLCAPDCAGLCPTCGADLNADPGHRHEAPVDPRFQVLSDFPADQPASTS